MKSEVGFVLDKDSNLSFDRKSCAKRILDDNSLNLNSIQMDLKSDLNWNRFGLRWKLKLKMEVVPMDPLRLLLAGHLRIQRVDSLNFRKVLTLSVRD